MIIEEGVGIWKELWLVVLASVAITVLVLLPFALWIVKRRREQEATYESRVDEAKLALSIAHSLEKQEPLTISELLTYMKPEKAKKILEALSPDLRERVVAQLTKRQHNTHRG